MMYFSYDFNGNGFETHKTEEKAKESAQQALDYEKGEAVCDGWGDDVTRICWGKVIETVKVVPGSERKATKDEPFDDYLDYELGE